MLLTGFNGWPETDQKTKSWALLAHLATFVDGPWCCIEDFNAILYAAEKQSAYPPLYKQMEEFGIALDSCGLLDLGFHGYPFTWNNKRPGGANTRQRLDRAVANTKWRSKFSASTITHLMSHTSDHLPSLMHSRLDKVFRSSGTCGFKFEEGWLLWADCEQTVEEAWKVRGISCSTMAAIQEKLHKCGAGLSA